MSDWMDDAASRAASGIEKSKQDVEAFKNKQRLIKARASVLWDEALGSLRAALEKINEGFPKIRENQPPPTPENIEVRLTYLLATPIEGTMVWRPMERRVNMSVVSKRGSPRVYEFDVEDGGVVLKGNGSTLKSGDDLAREFVEMLTAV